MKDNMLSIKEAAELMGTSEQFLRIGLQRKQIPIGYAVKNKTRWFYVIPRQLFEATTGIKVPEALAEKGA